jgi:hypothetical protein
MPLANLCETHGFEKPWRRRDGELDEAERRTWFPFEPARVKGAG